MTEFTPVAALIGGVIIGCAAVFLMAVNGRIAGVCRIYGDVFPPWASSDIAWRVAFVLGLIAAPAVALLAGQGSPAFSLAASPAVLTVGGVLVGAGATVGSGCTSGHGVCGLGRVSPRSMVAVGTFMATAFVTVFVTRHILGG
jgi:uncharacterized membrane protein YedE/YeeE